MLIDIALHGPAVEVRAARDLLEGVVPLVQKCVRVKRAALNAVQQTTAPIGSNGLVITYVALRFEQEKAPWKDQQSPQRGQAVYALIEQGPETVSHTSAAPPPNGQPVETTLWCT